MRIVLIGTGNVATILGRKIRGAGHQLVQVMGRTATTTQKLAHELQADYTTSVQHLDRSADLYIIAVADAAIASVAAELTLNDKLLVHTAGSVSKEVLKAGSSRYGVFYPLQSLRASMQQLPAIPFLVDANNEENVSFLRDLALQLSPQVGVANDEQRLKLHVAAVIVSNFTNHLYTLAARYCEAENVSFDLLHPLIQQVADRLQYMSPSDAQTGPAIRGDAPTIQKHLELLAAHGELQELYAWFSKSIQRKA